ncbi:VOC family protein [Ornithinibacillus scapharcae]|uniref:VOC family protein n=1 Tax=Ornithinibacillus scapharcae TaxID=1147159 RepID=UPI000225AE55|nr:VOC family protein [Ornithinibacillus scapharcae]
MKSPIQNKVNTIFIHVSNLEQSVAWYCDLLGQDFDLATVSRPVYNLQVNQEVGITLDAGPLGTEKNIKALEYPLFNFHTEDIDAAYDYLKELNYEIADEIIRFDDLSFFTVKDPDQHIIMICTG